MFFDLFHDGNYGGKREFKSTDENILYTRTESRELGRAAKKGE